jgi:hypothetical protein
MWGNVFCLAFAASLAFEAVAQTTITVGADDEDDSFSSVTTSATNSEDPRTCGYFNGGMWFLSTQQYQGSRKHN